MSFNSQAFASSRPLALRTLHDPILRCVRRRASSITKTTPKATRATLLPDSHQPSAVDPTSASVSASSSPQSVEDLPPADQARIIAVRRQMEFWFSASNLRRDWYLRRQMDDQGWLDPSIFLRFNRVKSLHATLHDIIIACKVSDELEVATYDSGFGDVEGQTRIRRSPGLPDFRDWDEEELSRSFLLKRIPSDSSVESLGALLEPMATPSYIRVYRTKDMPVTASALICFEDIETANHVFETFSKDNRPETKGIIIKRRQVLPEGADEAVAGEPTPTPKPNLLVFEVTDLPSPLDWKSLYDQLGKTFLEKAGVSLRYLLYEQRTTTCYVTVADNPASRIVMKDFADNGVLIDETMCPARFLQDPDEIRNYWAMANEYQAKRKARRAERDATLDPSSDNVMSRNPQGVIVRIEGFDDDTTWRMLKLDLEEMGRLVYLSFDRKTGSCFARFGTSAEARTVADMLSGDNPRPVCDLEVKAFVLYGDEEEEYWERAEKARAQKQRRQDERNQNDGDEYQSAQY